MFLTGTRTKRLSGLKDFIYTLSFFPYRYVLLHHVMAQVAGVRGAWGYPEGGMGGVTQAMARAAEEAGVDIFTNQVIINVQFLDNMS